MKENILVSACLLGVNCKYNGENNFNEQVISLMEKYNLVPVCPEIFGGLETPRKPCEINISSGKVINCENIDVTGNFKRGAEETLKLAKLYNIKFALLKEKSPSCGFGQIYDGSFNKKLVQENGVTANLLNENGIEIIGETRIDILK